MQVATGGFGVLNIDPLILNDAFSPAVEGEVAHLFDSGLM
jgi:hypothetical protein